MGLHTDAVEPAVGGMASGTRKTRQSRKKRVLLVMAATLAIVLVAGLAWFEPWKLWINKTVNEAAPAGSVLIAQGSFVTHEHHTSGAALVLRLPDGRRVLRLDRLDTSNGPVLKVWLSDAPVRSGKAGWKVFDTGRQIDLGRLKGNKGSQNYLIPQDANLTRLTSVTIWCDRFNVSFGAAALTATG
jgi:hypothetical protein